MKPSDRSRPEKGVWTYTASASYKFDIGVMPYVTYAMNSALSVRPGGRPLHQPPSERRLAAEFKPSPRAA